MVKNYIVIEEAAEMDYLRDFVALPKNYGTREYFERPDVKEIRRAVHAALQKIDEKIDLGKQIGGRHVVIKPNLVIVCYNAGFEKAEMPQTTDPRVFEAVVDYISRYTKRITIAESSGSGLGTMANIKLAGYVRIAKHYGCEIEAFENMPVDRYMLPKAQVMKECLIPRILSEVVRGEAYYISVPKMKTNLFTGATLGFKNAMGSIPVKLRYRNHGYQINKKLVDLLYLFKPDLVVIDGIVGAEGLTPGPVDPVDTRMIVASNHAVEADRLTTDMMGLDSKTNKLIMEADAYGFGSPEVEVIGTPKYFNFCPADASLIGERLRENHPKVRVFVGRMPTDKHLKIEDKDAVTPEMVKAMESMCDGGCTPALATLFEMYKFGKKTSKKHIECALIYGLSVTIGGEDYYFDYQGKPYTTQEIAALPIKKLAIGECARGMEGLVDVYSGGCVDVATITTSIRKVTGMSVPVLSAGNKGLPRLGLEAFRTYRLRKRMLRDGEYFDIEYEPMDHDKIIPIPDLGDDDLQKDYIEWPMPEMTEEKRKELQKKLKIIDF